MGIVVSRKATIGALVCYYPRIRVIFALLTLSLLFTISCVLYFDCKLFGAQTLSFFVLLASNKVMGTVTNIPTEKTEFQYKFQCKPVNAWLFHQNC